VTDLTRYGIFKARLPLPFKLDHVNCYAMKGGDGWTIIDAGLNYEATRRAWPEFMKEHGFTPGDVTGIYVTHYHPDHYGAAGWLQELCGAPVYMNATEASLSARMWREENVELVAGMFLENGMPAEIVPTILADMAVMRSRTRPQPRITPLYGGEVVRLGSRDYQVLLTPGHSDGHICFYDEESGLLLSGDHLLPHISSNISLWPMSHPDPLDNFLTSLAENHRLRVSMALPAHGECFTNVQERVAALEAHHQERLELMRRTASRGASVYQVSREVFGDGLSVHEVRFAMTETLAHLAYLERRGQLAKSRVDGVWTYTGTER